MILMLWGLGACSLSQEDSSQQVRIVISPEALRSSRLLSSPKSPGVQAACVSGSGLPPTYFLINVEGPGIPSIAVPNLPCVPLGLGTSVLVPASGQTFCAGDSTDLPIELMVPAGIDRKINLYEVQIIAPNEAALPASGTSATQYFSMNSPGVRALDLRFHAEAFLPDLFSEQTVVLDKAPAPALSFCPYPGAEPPVLQKGKLTLSKYRPYQKEGVNFYEPNRSGPIRLWAAPINGAFFLRFSGELEREGGGLLSADFVQSIELELGSSMATPTPAFQSAPTGPLFPAVAWFQAAYPVPSPHVEGTRSFQHTVGSIIRNGILDVSLGNPFPGGKLTPEPTVFSNVFYVDVSPETSATWIRPLARDALFGFAGSTIAQVEVVGPVNIPNGAVFNSAPPPPCPREGFGFSPPEFLGSSGCRLFFAVWNSSPSTNFKLDIEAAIGAATAPPPPQEFRQAQLSTFDINVPLPPSGEYVFPTRPDETSYGVSTSFTLVYPTQPWSEVPEIVSWEVSGPGFRVSSEEGAVSPWGVTVSDRDLQVTKPVISGGSPSCITRVSILAEGTNQGGVNVFRRDAFILPACGTPDPPSEISAELVVDSVLVSQAPVKISWTNGTTAGGAELQYLIERGLPLPGGSPNSYETIAECSFQGAASPCVVSGPRVSFIDETAVPGVLYSYRIRAQGIASNLLSAPSQEARIRPIGPISLSTPELVPPAGAYSNPALRLSWSGALGATSFMVQMRPVNATSWVSFGEVITGNSWDVFTSTLIPGTAYQFRVIASNDSGINTPANGDTRESQVVVGTLMDQPWIASVCTPLPGMLKVNLEEANSSLVGQGVRGATSVQLSQFVSGVGATLGDPKPCNNQPCTDIDVPFSGQGQFHLGVTAINANGVLSSIPQTFNFSDVLPCGN